MKHIKKNQEPEKFTNWKALENDDWKPSWDDNFQTPEKPVVHDALLKEQGYICCYCGMRITRTATTEKSNNASPNPSNCSRDNPLTRSINDTSISPR